MFEYFHRLLRASLMWFSWQCWIIYKCKQKSISWRETSSLTWCEVKRDETLTTTDGFNVCTLQRRCSVKCSCTFSLPVKHFVSPEMQILLVCLVSSLFSLRLRCLASVLIHKFVTFLVSPCKHTDLCGCCSHFWAAWFVLRWRERLPPQAGC